MDVVQTFGELADGIGATELPGTDLIVVIMRDGSIAHMPLSEVRNAPAPADAHVYFAGGAFAAGTVSEKSGRKQDNLRAVLWLQFDADLQDYSGMPAEVLHTLPDDDIQRWIKAMREDLESCMSGIGLPIHRLDYTGYGLCAYLYLEPTLDADIATIRDAHKAFIKAINDKAGIRLVDPVASDAGTRITRLPGTYNVKNPARPRLVKTLAYHKGQQVTMDQVKFALRRAMAAPDPVTMPERRALPMSIADEIVSAIEPHWTLGQKHALALALSGMLAKAGIPEEQTLGVIERLSGGDAQPFDRVRCVQDTYKRLHAGQDNRGFMSLREMIPADALTYITERIDRITRATAPGGVFSFEAKARSKDGQENKFTSSLNVQPVPDICFNGWVGDYVSMMLPLSEAPESFHLASGLGLIGASAGRKVSARYIKRLYANHFFMLVGIAGYSRKDTAIEFALEFPDHMSGRSFNSAPFQILTDVGSPQGLMEYMQKYPNIWLYVTEYERLAANAHRSSTSAIFPLLTTAWNTPTKIQNVTKGSPMEAKFPYLSTIAAVQPDILSKNMLPEDISNGFASRWLFIPGEGGDPLAYPPAINEVQAHDHYASLLRTVDRYGDSDRDTMLELAPDALERWTAWYKADRRTMPESDDEASMRSRLGVHIQKIALTYAIGDGEQSHIQLSQLESAIAFVEWSWSHTRQMMKEWGVPAFNAIEVKVEQVLRSNGPMKRRVLQGKCKNRRWGATDFAKVLEAMVRNGTVEIDAEGNHAIAS